MEAEIQNEETCEETGGKKAAKMLKTNWRVFTCSRDHAHQFSYGGLFRASLSLPVITG